MSKSRTAPKPSPYQASPETLTHLAHLVHQARPDWDTGLVRIVLADLARSVDGSDLAVASIRAACDPLGRGHYWVWARVWVDNQTRGPRIRVCVACGGRR
jgi:hypothetical protein